MPTVDGIVSGIETTSIINQLLQVARTPINALESRVATLTTRREKLQELNTLLSTLQTSLESVDAADDLPAFAATSSQPDALGVTASGGAFPGGYDIRVDQLATSSLLLSQGFSSADEVLREGTLGITVDSVTTEVEILASEGTNTPQGLAARINSTVLGVHAYVLDTGSGGTPYRLIIEGTATGADHEVTTTLTFGAPGGTELALSTQRSALDAQLDIDGIAVSSETNQPQDLLPGLALDLQGTTSGPARVTVGRDSDAMAAKVQAVVDAYNAIVDYFDENIGIDADAAIQGDQTIRTIQRRLQEVLGAGYGNTEIAGLNSVGLGTAQDGHLEFDAAVFGTAAGAGFDALVDVLTGSSGLFGAMYAEVDLVVDPTTGIVQPRLDSIDSQVEDLGDRITRAEARLEAYETMLRAQFTAMETLLAQYQATGDYLAAMLQQNDQS